jgi:hypothetical protein
VYDRTSLILYYSCQWRCTSTEIGYVQPCKVRCRTFTRKYRGMLHSFLWCLDSMCPSNKSCVRNSRAKTVNLEYSLHNCKQRISTDGMPSSFYVVINVDVKHDLSLSCIDLFENSEQTLFVSHLPSLFKPCPQLN